MARKDVLIGLLATPAPSAAAPPRAQKGAIGAVSRSIADLKARSVIELDPDLIEAGGLQDRLESDAVDDSALARSIGEYGQQVPVLVRPHPEVEGRFQIVYGRRRVLAMRALGQPVKALVRDLDDRALVLAQGQENTARRDLSFIEKVNFARQLQDAGYDRKVICDALSVDKTLASRMLSVAGRLPAALIEAIGAAPSVGRDRWLALADLVEAGGDGVAAAVGESSDARFQAVWDHLTTQATTRQPAMGATPLPRPAPRVVLAIGGAPLAEASLGATTLTLKLRLTQTAGFEDWLLDNLPALLRDWQSGKPNA
ncbi:plasmid partitioning protein RepB [Cypionkella aquatica]|uniref:Plasmid partitioning protein RepB n=1 Tax=Cypionkella aquatica TaxID=1756042 RepID=A0AA37X3M1_9RHOB|nr:plasmid partitioning protein RepB [Cypionkella aquatica]GLS88774.1 plasmid partitioning protein RepB [Cypionkella aquatica]